MSSYRLLTADVEATLRVLDWLRDLLEDHDVYTESIDRLVRVITATREGMVP
jgi:hypothetical protein